MVATALSINLVFNKQGGPRDSQKERKKEMCIQIFFLYSLRPPPSRIKNLFLLSHHLNLDAANVAYVW